MGVDKNKKKDDDSAVSPNDLRNTLYSRYEAELKNIWQHSVFAWGFEILLFTGYAYLIANFFLKIEDNFIPYTYLNTIAVIISFIGLCTSAIWIALVKSRKTWQEFFEALITEFESNTDYFPFQRVFAMSGFHCRLENLDSKLYTTNIGKFSPSKLNIFIAQFTWCIWLGIIVFHSVFGETIAPMPIMIALISLCYLLFRLVLNRNCSNGYFENEDYGKEYAFDSYLKIKRLEKQFYKVKYEGIESLTTFVLRDLQACKWNFKQYCEAEYKELIDDFKRKLINEDFDSLRSISFKNKIENLINAVKARVREEYDE